MLRPYIDNGRVVLPQRHEQREHDSGYHAREADHREHGSPGLEGPELGHSSHLREQPEAAVVHPRPDERPAGDRGRDIDGVKGKTATVRGQHGRQHRRDRKSTRLNSSHLVISYAVFCLKKKKKTHVNTTSPQRRTENDDKTQSPHIERSPTLDLGYRPRADAADLHSGPNEVVEYSPQDR